MRKIVRVFAGLVLGSVLANCGRSSVRAGASITGAWVVAETRTVWAGGEGVVAAPQPGLVIFTERHYSIGQVPGSQPRKPSEKPWFPTEKEKINDFDTVIFNSGTYERTGPVLTLRPIVAKTPEFMNGEAVYTVKVLRDTLWMTGTVILSYRGDHDPGVDRFRTTMKLIRAE